MSSILIIDDDETLRSMLIDYLTEKGYSVFSAKEGYEAIRLLKEKRFDLIITDILMPEKDGLEII